MDFKRIYEHYAYERGFPNVANKIDLGIREETGDLLPSQPGIGRRVHPDKPLRAYLVLGSHWIFYTYDDDAIYVHNIRAARELQSWDFA